MEIKSRKTEKKLKQEICLLNDFLIFLSKILQNRNKTYNKILSRLFNLKSRFNNIISRYIDIASLPHVIVPPVCTGEKINQLEPSIMLNK